jgi:hypothetical protein
LDLEKHGSPEKQAGPGMGDFGIMNGEWCVVNWETTSSAFFSLPNAAFLIHIGTVEG